MAQKPTYKELEQKINKLEKKVETFSKGRWTPLSGQPENGVKLWARLLRTRLQAASANG
jgi:hypothetical protein